MRVQVDQTMIKKLRWILHMMDEDYVNTAKALLKNLTDNLDRRITPIKKGHRRKLQGERR